MSAKEMFKKLGYSGAKYYFTRRLTQNSVEAIEYIKEGQSMTSTKQVYISGVDLLKILKGEE